MTRRNNLLLYIGGARFDLDVIRVVDACTLTLIPHSVPNIFEPPNQEPCEPEPWLPSEEKPFHWIY